eukprot:TRINITY_DN1187_c0_g1_i1.p1 TRINITY_DN1187_c0_g1~~TRINITY_DN1187_c0_g1_i1.p1  ORF type:complete len:158 (-),score=51.50 TRINITY_DN1187_c0_g1_i1:30-503(-)
MSLIKNIIRKIKQKAIDPIIGELNKITKHQFCLAISIGFLCGIFPIPGTTLFVCFLVRLIIPINLIIAQSINIIVTPLNLLLVPFFFGIGSWLIPFESAIKIEEVIERFKKDFLGALIDCRLNVLQAIGAWLLLAPIFLLFSYFLTFLLLWFIKPKY